MISRQLVDRAQTLMAKYFGNSSASETNIQSEEPNFSQLAAQISEQFLPPRYETDGVGTLANFASNQTLHTGFRAEILAELGQPPDGYLVGVGAATLFALLYLFEGHECQGILGVDVMPQPIVTGQIVVEMLKSNPTFEDFQRECTLEKIDEYYQVVLESQSFSLLRHAFEKIDRVALVSQLGLLMKEEIQETAAIARRISLGAQAEARFTSPFERKRIIVLAAIRDRYTHLRALAVADKIGFAWADFASSDVLRAIQRGLPDYDSKRNVIHESNMVDHIAIREADYDQTAEAMAQLEILDNGHSIFTGTTRAEKYELAHSQHPFSYTYDQLADNLPS